MLRKHAMKCHLVEGPLCLPASPSSPPFAAPCDQVWLRGLSWAKLPWEGYLDSQPSHLLSPLVWVIVVSKAARANCWLSYLV